MESRGLILSWALVVVANAEPAEITGVISKGEAPVAKKIELKELSEGDLEREIVVQKEGRRIIYQEVSEESSDEVLETKRDQIPAQSPAVSSEPPLPQVSYTVWARVFPEKGTLVKWWNGPEENFAWSNVDFNHLGGFHRFKKNEKSYTFQLLVESSNDTVFSSITAAGNKEGITMPPAFDEGQPGFQMISDVTEASDAENLILGLHEIYAAREADLKEATQKRAENSEARKLADAQPKVKEDIIIRYRATTEAAQPKAD